MGGSLTVLVAGLLATAFDPVIDQALEPSSNLSVRVGVQSLQNEFGLTLQLATPRFLDDRLAVVLGGGIGWYPDLRALPETVDDQNFGAWSLYGHARLLAEFSTRIALASGRLYAAVGPSVLLLSEQLSSTRFSPGVYGVAGIELFAGDAFRAYPFSFYFEIGGVGHTAAADVVERNRPGSTTNSTVDRPIGTGLALSGGVRIYL